MVNLSDCINAEPGSFSDTPPPPGGDTGGGGGNVGPLPPAVGETNSLPPTGGGGPPPPPYPNIGIPDTLVCNGPTNVIGCMDPLANNFNINATIPCVGCCDYGEDGGPGGGGTSEGLVDSPTTQTFVFPIPTFTLGDIDVNLGQTKHIIVPANGSISQAGPSLDLGVGHLDFNTQGPLALIPGGPVEAELIDLPYYNNSLPSIRITIPTDNDSLEYYANNTPTGNIIGSFDILYVIDPPGNPEEYIEFYRHHVFFTSLLTLESTVVTAPSIVYPDHAIKVHSNADPSDSNPEEVTPLEFELNGNNLINITVVNTNPGTLYTQDNGYITVDNDGRITTNSYGDVSEVLSAPLSVTIFFEFDGASDIIIEFPIEIINDTPGPPEFNFGDPAGVVYYGADAPQSFITPQTWDYNGNAVEFQVNQLKVWPQGCGSDSVCWPTEPTSDFHPEISLDVLSTGVIVLEPWNTDNPVTYPGDLIVNLYWHTLPTNSPDFVEGFIDITIPLTYVAALTSDGSNEDTVKVYNKDTGSTLTLPKNYSALKGAKRVTYIKTGSGPKTRGSFSGPRGVLRITSKEVSTDQKMKQKINTSYRDGLREPNFTFFHDITPSQNIRVGGNPADLYYAPGSPARKSSFSEKGTDFVVADIVTINSRAKAYNDFSYNALTEEKVRRSLSSGLRSALTQAGSLDGSPFIDKTVKNIKKALISNELPRYSAVDINELLRTSAGKKIPLSTDRASNHSKAVDLMVENSIPLGLDNYTVADKNRMLNWKCLAQDLNKNIKVKTSDGSESPWYIPNSEMLTVYDTTGGAHDLEMQDGDYFITNTLSSENRLNVYSDREKAKVLTPQGVASASRLLSSDTYMDLTCTSIDSALIELDVDTTGVRQDYYFLALDKATIEEAVPGGIGVRKTTAAYDYITATSAIDDYVKHKAFPYLTVYIRDDDIIFNHLESSLTAEVSFTEPSLEYLTNMDTLLLARRMPWYLLVIPTDVTRNLESQTRSIMNNFSSRTLSLGFTSNKINTKDSVRDNQFLIESITEEDKINFSGDRVDRVIYKESREYSVNYNALTTTTKYSTGAEIIPRKLHPTGVILKKLNELKDLFSLTDRESIKFYDLYSRMAPNEFRSLQYDQVNLDTFLNKLRVNKVTESKSINKEKFVAVKDVYVLPTTVVDILDTGDGQVVFTKQPTSAAAGAPTDAPQTRPGGGVSF